jgi:thioredoxin-like negative regulator of GroEL
MPLCVTVLQNVGRLVLFTDAHCDKCKDAKLALIDVSVDGQPILAEVSVLDSPKTSKRFSVSKVPELRLFCDRHMYVYEGDLNGPAIKEFVQGGWKNTVAEDVPAETSWLADSFDELRNLANACLQVWRTLFCISFCMSLFLESLIQVSKGAHHIL